MTQSSVLTSSSLTKEQEVMAVLQDPSVLAYLMPAGLAIYASRGTWKPARHLMMLNEAFLAVAAGEITRLIVTMPPRHGKSEFLSKYAPAWFLGRFPNERIILASYESDFAASWGRKTRDVLEEYGKEIFHEVVSGRSFASDRWDLASRSGGMNTAGVGGATTGKGAQLFLIDDPVKGPEQAMSKTYRDRTWDWYQAVAYTRLEPNGKIILTLTRWNEDDLAGRILKQAAEEGSQEKWAVINLPALAEENDMLGREVGAPLWPERFSKATLLRTKATLSPYWWAALYQQRPSPQEGGIFKRNWMRMYRGPAPKCTKYVQSWDMAFKDLKSSAYVCGQVWGQKGADFYLIDQVRKKLDFPASVKEVRLVTSEHPEASEKLIEEAANGYAVIQTLKNEIPGIIPIIPGKDGGKESRASACSYLFEAGNVHIPEDRSWSEDYIEELVTFPNGVYKDQVDTTTQALNRLRTKTTPVVSPGGVTQTSKWRDQV
jgi:predicted phage terminase large subunit-like protein